MNKAAFAVATVTMNPAIDLAITIDDFAPGAVNRVSAQRARAGGKGVNVAAALADASLPVAVTGFLGQENSGIFEALFQEKKITDHFLRTEGQTRFGLKITDPSQRQTTDINFPGWRVAEGEFDRLKSTILALDAPWFVLAGSLPPGVPDSAYRDLITLLHERDRKVLLDTSGPALRLALEAAPDLVKPNQAELEELVGQKLATPGEVVQAARELLRHGIGLAVVSMGREGACFVTKKESLLAVPPEVEVVSTVGAGDAMVAGLILARLRNLSLEQTARLATACSLDVITRGGSGLSSPAAFDAFLPRIAVRLCDS